MTRQEEIFRKIFNATKSGKMLWFAGVKGYLSNLNSCCFKIDLLENVRYIAHKEFVIDKKLMGENNIISSDGVSVKIQQELEDLCTMIKEQIQEREDKEFHRFMAL